MWMCVRAHTRQHLNVLVLVCVCACSCARVSAGSMLSQAESSLPSYSSLSVFSSGVQVGHSSFISTLQTLLGQIIVSEQELLLPFNSKGINTRHEKSAQSGIWHPIRQKCNTSALKQDTFAPLFYREIILKMKEIYPFLCFHLCRTNVIKLLLYIDLDRSFVSLKFATVLMENVQKWALLMFARILVF